MTTPDAIAGHAAAQGSEARTLSTPKEPPRTPRRGLYVRHVTRMSGDLSAAVAAAARSDGLTAGAWVRRQLLDRVDMQSAQDARSGRPIRKPEEDQAAIAAAVRELATVSMAVAADDKVAAKAALDRARSVLIPLALRRPPA